MTCDLCRAAIVERWMPGGPVPPESGAHLERCHDCRSWFTAFADGFALSEADGTVLTSMVLARTSGGCGRVRELLAGRPDTALADIDAHLVGGHLAGCAACSEMAVVLDAARLELASLAMLEPGPGFVEGVLERTSRRAAQPTLTDRWRGVWERLVSRPRLAWEVAYVATLCWLVFFGPSVSALEWTTARVATVAREHVPSKLDALGDAFEEWRATVSAELGTASTAVEQRRGSWFESAAITFEKSLAWVQQTAVALLDGLEAAVRAAASWVAEFVGGLTADPTEPAKDAARSHQ